MRAAGGDSSSSRARRSRPSRSRFRASPSAICMLWSTTGISWRFRVTERALARDVVVEGRQDHPRLRYGPENSLLRAGEVAPEVTADIVRPPAHRHGRATVARRRVVRTRSVLRMIAAPCVGFRPASGCRPPGPRRDTASSDSGAATFSGPSGAISTPPDTRLGHPKTVQSCH